MQTRLEKWPLFVFLASGMLCLFFSASFHLFYCMDEQWFAVLARLDYTGIGLLIGDAPRPACATVKPMFRFMCVCVCSGLRSARCVLRFLLPPPAAARASHLFPPRLRVYRGCELHPQAQVCVCVLVLRSYRVRVA